MGRTEKAGLILVASANPSSWRRVNEALRERFAISYAVDLGGTLDVVTRHRPAVVILCSALLDAKVEEAIARLEQRAPAARLIVVGPSGAGKGASGGLVAAYLEEKQVAGSLLDVVESVLDVDADGPQRPAASCQADPPSSELASLISLPAYREMVLGESENVRRLMDSARRVAPYEVTVLITGESGTGKEVLARWIHCASRRAEGPFESVDLPSVPVELFESILFGHERGSFTGAVAPNEGKFQRAHDGTLFLDEISSLKLELQPKLLRAIQEKQVECVGGKKLLPCNARIIAATNVDLEEAVSRGEFRSDLLYRLNVITLETVPLRERAADIPALLDFFVAKYAKRFERRVPQISRSSVERLKQHHWPGNIRELENRAQRALLLARSDTLEPDDFFEPTRRRTAAVAGEIDFGSCDRSLAEVERLYIESVLRSTEGNQSRAAQTLQITRKTLRNKLQSDPEQKRPLRQAAC